MAKFIRAYCASVISYDGDETLWDFCSGSFETDDKSVIERLLDAGAELVSEEPEEVEEVEEEELAFKTKKQIVEYAMDEYGVEMTASSNKTMDEMLVELQAIAQEADEE